MALRNPQLAHDQRGVVYAEFLLAFTPFFLIFLALIQLSLIASGSLVVQHAASKSARAAMVVLPDDPFFYQGEDAYLLDFQGSSDDSSFTSSLSSKLGGAGVPSPTSNDSSGASSFSLSAPQASSSSSSSANQGVGGPRLNAIRLAANVVLAPLAPEPLLLLSWMPSGLGLDWLLSAAGLQSRPSLKQTTYGKSPSLRFLTGLAVYNSMAAAINFPVSAGSTALRNQGKEFKGQVSYEGDKQVTVRVTYLLPCSVPVVSRIICPKINPGNGSGWLGIYNRARNAVSSGKTLVQQGKDKVSGAIGDVKNTIDGAKAAVPDAASCLRKEAVGLRDGLRSDATDLRDGVLSDVNGLKDGLKDDAVGLRDGLIGDAKDLANGAKNQALGIVTDGKNLLGGVKQDAQNLAKGLNADGSQLGQDLQNDGSQVVKPITDIPGDLGDDAQGLGDGLQDNANGLGNQLGDQANALKDVGAACVKPAKDAAGNLINQPANSQFVDVIDTTDAAGREVLICLDQAGHKLVTTFDEAGTRIEQTVNASGELVFTTVDAAQHRVESTVSSTGERIDRTVDQAGNEVEIAVDAAGNRVKTTVDAAGNRVVETIDSVGNRVITGYDTLHNKVVTTIDQSGKRVDEAYNSAGQRIETTYDGIEQRAVATYDGAIKRTENTFDAAGNCVQTAYDTLTNAPTTILTTASGQVSQLESDGQHVLDTLHSGSPDDIADLLLGEDPGLTPQEQALMDELHAGIKQVDLMETMLRASSARFYVVRREATMPLQTAAYRYPTWKKFAKDKNGDRSASR